MHGRKRLIAVLVCLIGLISAGAAGSLFAQAPAAPAVAVAPTPPAPPESIEAQAKRIIETRCAGCHEQAARTPGQPAAALQAILDLEFLKTRSALLRPGRPDASTLYQLMLRNHAPLQIAPPASLPTPEEIDTVRQWIEEIPPQQAPTCDDRRRVTLGDVGTALQRLREPGGASLKGIRFISLVSFYNGCATPAAMEDLRRAVSELVTALRTTLVDFDLPLAGDNVPVLAVRLGDMGWSASQWDALAATAHAPRLTTSELTNAFETATPVLDVSDLAVAAYQSGAYPKVAEMKTGGQAFLVAGRADVDLATAANHVGVTSAAFTSMLDTVTGPAEAFARRLRQGTIPREAWHRLRAALPLAGGTAVLGYQPEQAADTEDLLDVGLWTDKISYRKGDLLVITAQASRDCHLTIINVDPRGDATILFPSDSDPDNAIKAGSKVRVPSEIEPYQLRANEPGTETFVAVCTLNRKRMIGVDQDFEKQRFTTLGNWRTFLATAHTRESLVGRRDTPRQRRARAKADAAAAAIQSQPEQEARAAIYVKIE